MAITSRAKVKAEISTGTGSGDTTSMLIPLWDRPLLHIGGKTSPAVATYPWTATRYVSTITTTTSAADGTKFASAAELPLGYNGYNMHHRIIVTNQGQNEDSGDTAQDLDVVIVYVSASDDKSGFVEVARYDGATNSDPVLITGSIDQPPYKHVMVEIVRDTAGGSGPYSVKTATTISVESWGTVIH